MIVLLSFLLTYLRLSNAWQSTKKFFEPQLSDLALSRNIGMGIKEIAARVDLINREKTAVETVVLQYGTHNKPKIKRKLSYLM